MLVRTRVLLKLISLSTELWRRKTYAYLGRKERPNFVMHELSFLRGRIARYGEFDRLLRNMLGTTRLFFVLLRPFFLSGSLWHRRISDEAMRSPEEYFRTCTFFPAFIMDDLTSFLCFSYIAVRDHWHCLDEICILYQSKR